MHKLHIKCRKSEDTYNFHGDNFSFGNVFDSDILPIFPSNSCIDGPEASPSKNVPNLIQFIQFSGIVSLDCVRGHFVLSVAASPSGLSGELDPAGLLAHVCARTDLTWRTQSRSPHGTRSCVQCGRRTVHPTPGTAAKTSPVPGPGGETIFSTALNQTQPRLSQQTFGHSLISWISIIFFHL